MIYDPKESETDESPDLEIMDQNGCPLGEEDFDTVDEQPSHSIGMDEYEEL